MFERLSVFLSNALWAMPSLSLCWLSLSSHPWLFEPPSHLHHAEERSVRACESYTTEWRTWFQKLRHESNNPVSFASISLILHKALWMNIGFCSHSKVRKTHDGILIDNSRVNRWLWSTTQKFAVIKSVLLKSFIDCHYALQWTSHRPLMSRLSFRSRMSCFSPKGSNWNHYLIHLVIHVG